MLLVLGIRLMANYKAAEMEESFTIIRPKDDVSSRIHPTVRQLH